MTGAIPRSKVLVVDDEPQILDSIHDLLEDEFEVVTTDDANEAIKILRDSRIIVILADQRMPKLPGDQFLSHASEISDATRILVTGYADIDALIRSVNHGKIHSYVSKPWDPAALRVTVLNAATHAAENRRRKRAAEIVAEQQEALARSEAAYREQNRMLRSVLDSMSEGVLVADLAGKMLAANPAATGMVGTNAVDTPHAEWIRRFGIYVPGTETPYPPDNLPLARAMRGETADNVEMFLRNAQRPEGMYVSVNARPLKDDTGEIKGGVAVVRDITATKLTEDALRKAKEEAERANRAKSEFLSRMSHELRTPLNAILGFAQLIALSDPGRKLQENVQHILKGGHHLLDLINEILDLARIEAGRLSLSMEPVGIEDVVTETADLMKPIAAAQNISFSTDLDGYAGSYVLADRQRLKQVLLNLISNAIKFNSAHGQIRLNCRKGVAGRLLVEVSDTGDGIDDTGLQLLFKPFERLDADKKAMGGTGLGLAVSRSLIEAMGGSMGADSTKGVGSTFHFELTLTEPPVGLVHEEKLTGGGLSSGADASLTGTVLCIEDNASNTRLITEIISRYPCVRFLAAADGESGIDLALAKSPDWILLDLHLPDMGGEEVLLRLKSDPLTARAPVTILSADATPHRIGDLEKSGAREYLTKPIDVRRFIDLLESTLRQGDDRSPCGGPQPGTVLAAATNQASGPVSFTGLPDELIEEMRLAVAHGKTARLYELIHTVADQDTRCAEALRRLADNYDYDSLTTLLTPLQEGVAP